jgi:putative acetyltransferase
MKTSDIPRVAEIQVFAWRIADRGILSDDYLFNFATVAKRMIFFEELINSKTDETYVYDDGIIKGFVTLCPSADDDLPEAMQVSSIYIDPFFQREGIGTRLMGYTEKIAEARNVKIILLWVLEQNTIAQAFYKKLGFTPDGKTSTGGLGTVELRYIKKEKNYASCNN